MDELYIEWEELVEAGEVSEDFNDWYSGKVSDAYDMMEDRYEDEG